MDDQRGPVIDVHAHAAVPAALGLAADRPEAASARAAESETFGAQAQEVNARQMADLRPLFEDLGRRLDAMDAMGVDIQLISPSPVHYHDWAPLGTRTPGGADHAHGQRGHGPAGGRRPGPLARAGDRAVGASAARGRRAHSRGDRARAAGRRDLDLRRRARARRSCARAVGNPAETTLALSHIIFSGLLDRRPDLKILAAHGGGYLPLAIGRSDHAWQVREDCRTPRRPPSEYLRRLYFDSLVYQPQLLEALVRAAGADHVLLGTDFPFDMGVGDPLARVEAATGLTPEERAAIAGGSAARLLRIETVRFSLT